MEQQHKNIIYGGLAAVILIAVIYFVFLRKPAMATAQTAPGNTPPAPPKAAGAVLTQTAAIPPQFVKSGNSLPQANGYSPAPPVPAWADDCANGAFILLRSLPQYAPGADASLSAFNAMFAKCCNVTGETFGTTLAQPWNNPAFINRIGQDQYFSDVNDWYYAGGTVKFQNPPGKNYTPYNTWSTGGTVTANTADVSLTTDLQTLFTDLVNEYLQPIKNNLQRTNSPLTLLTYSNALNTLFANIALLGNSACPLTFTQAATSLINYDRALRQIIVLQQVLYFDANATNAVDDWYYFRSQVLFDVGISVPINMNETTAQAPNDIATYPGGAAFQNPPPAMPQPFTYFNDTEAIQILNYIQPIVAPTQAQIAAANAAAAASAAANQSATVSTILTIAKIAISFA